MEMSLRLYTQTRSKAKLRIIDITRLAMLTAVLLCVQVGLAFLPNIELVTLLIMLYTLIWGRQTLFVIYAFAIIEGILYGFGLWWINYLYVWTLLFAIVTLLKKNSSLMVWTLVSGFFGLCFGALCAIPYFIIGGLGAGVAWWIAGIPYDVIHGIANTIVTFVLFKPIFSLLDRYRK